MLLGFSHPGDLRPGVYDTGNGCVVKPQFETSDSLCGHNALGRCLVCQHRAAHHVTDRIDIPEVGLAMFIHMYETMFIQHEAYFRCTQSPRVGLAACRHDKSVNHQLFPVLLVLIGDGNFPVVGTGPRDPGTQPDIQPLATEDFPGAVCNLAIQRFKKLIECLKYHHF